MNKTYLQYIVTFYTGLFLPLTTIAQTQQWNVIPLPNSTMNIKNPVQSLNGNWKINLTPPPNFEDVSIDDQNWSDVVVPGEPAMQGFQVEHDKGFAYRKWLTIPKNYSGKRIYIRFDSVYSYAKVWINDRYLRDHIGGFTSWDCEITDYVTAGEKAILAVEVIDRTDDISFASGYAKHPIGGILRDVYMYCLPDNYIYNFDIETQFDDDYEDAVLKVSARLASSISGEVKLSLKDPFGKMVMIQPNQIRFDNQEEEMVTIQVKKPLKWDSEHPNLYTLTAELKQGWTTTEKIIQKIGFRKVEVSGNKILVNGKQVHLRGANRHDIHPVLGRTSGRELDHKDVLLAKEANINFIRTSHYPPSKAFLEYCDQYGIYVEEETAVCFIEQAQAPYGPAISGTQHKSEWTNIFLSRLYEMIDRDRNHASVIIWSTGNENHYGVNFQKSYELIKQLDSTRPVIFSYPNTAGKNVCYDIVSEHYPSWTGSSRGVSEMNHFERIDRPVICDEWAHVACYKEDFDVKYDPGIRDFWGESLRVMWENAYVSNGTAGGAIWGMIDETFQLPDKCVGYGEWGIFDTWRRKKPEFWATKKAYSPIRIDESTTLSIIGGKEIEVPVKNWFDHTDFSELLIKYQVSGQSGTLQFSLTPGQTGKLKIPAEKVKMNDSVHLKFYNQFGKQSELIDEFNLPLEKRIVQVTKLQGPAPKLDQNENDIIVAGENFTIIFDKERGCIKNGTYKGKRLLTGGPSLHLSPMKLSAFDIKEVYTETNTDFVKVYLAGNHGAINVTYDIRIDGKGTMEITYTISNLPDESKCFHEVGLAFDLIDEIDTLQWDRDGLYTVYPDNHIGRNVGMAQKVSLAKDAMYRKQPQWDWSQNMHDFFYIGTDHEGYGMTFDFRSMKTNIYSAVAANSKAECGLHVKSDGQSHAVRMQTTSDKTSIDDRSIQMLVNQDWAYNLGWGNKNREFKNKSGFTDTVILKLTPLK